MNETPYTIGELAVWRIINPPAKPTWYNVETPHDGKLLIDTLARADLKNASIWANVFGLCEWDGTEFTEWYDPETGEGIDGAFEDDECNE